MRILFYSLFGIIIAYSSTTYGQDTNVYKREFVRFDTCKNKVVPHWVGCGHPDYICEICDGHILKKVEIYDRWGMEIFETNNVLNTWNLKDKNNRNIKQGTYYYRIEYKDQSGRLKEDFGYFQFIP